MECEPNRDNVVVKAKFEAANKVVSAFEEMTCHFANLLAAAEEDQEFFARPQASVLGVESAMTSWAFATSLIQQDIVLAEEHLGEEYAAKKRSIDVDRQRCVESFSKHYREATDFNTLRTAFAALLQSFVDSLKIDVLPFLLTRDRYAAQLDPQASPKRKGRRPDPTKLIRDRNMFQRFNELPGAVGERYAQLARTHDLEDETVRKIVSKQKAAAKKVGKK